MTAYGTAASSGSSAAVLSGIVAGVLFMVASLAAALVFSWRRCKRKNINVCDNLFFSKLIRGNK